MNVGYSVGNSSNTTGEQDTFRRRSGNHVRPNLNNMPTNRSAPNLVRSPDGVYQHPVDPSSGRVHNAMPCYQQLPSPLTDDRRYTVQNYSDTFHPRDPSENIFNPRAPYLHGDPFSNRNVDDVNNGVEPYEYVAYDHCWHKNKRPVSAYNSMPYYHGHRNDHGMMHNSHCNNDVEDYVGYIDQQGDDYQINTYFNTRDEVVNPSIPNGYVSDYGYYDYDKMADPAVHFTDSNGDFKEVSHYGMSPGVTPVDDYDDISNEKVDSKSPPIARNKRTIMRKFKLWFGNFVFDCPISDSLISLYASGMSDGQLTSEYRFMRYQAVTCDPADFQRNNFTLRQLKFMVPRNTSLMIVVTMYNESDVLLARTLKGIMDNIKHFTKRRKSSVWGADAWKKVTVCIVADGRNAINERALALMSSLGCYQDGFAKDEINGKKVVAHVYEHTTKINISRVSGSKIKLACGDNTVPVQLLFCLKERNQKKINSHRWAFEGFAPVLQPKVIMLLDVGTMPGKDSIYQLWKEFDDPNIGGACGEIKTDLGPRYAKLLNPLVASQNFEYKMSNILDKTTESNFGYISVLPGAFSAYRYAALKGEPMKKYFMGENLNSTIFVSNMYLAEDRILCFEIVTKKEARWLLKYCRSSYGSTDVPDRVPEFILQRRRWLNGSFFAALYSFVHFYKIWSSGHTFVRKILLTIEFVYLFITTLIAWFSLSSFFLVFRILTLSLTIVHPEQPVFRYLAVILLWLYGINVLIIFILSLGNKPKGTPNFYLITFIFFAILMVYMVFCALFMAVHSIERLIDAAEFTVQGLFTSATFRDLVISMASTYCLYFLASLVYLQPTHMITSFLQYVLLSPSYINILNIYAFCNVHDISWGTKGAVAKPLGKLTSKEDGFVRMEIPISSKEVDYNYKKYVQLLETPDDNAKNRESPPYEDQKTSYLAMVRSMVIIIWIISNFVVIAAVLETGVIRYHLHTPTGQESELLILSKNASIYFSVVLWMVAVMAAVRFVGCSVYLVRRLSQKFTLF
ncbi:HBR528Cp [Eremothecium sinecaudum]|uniref:chitin synthase n=1 Tax=Eremothecium sinecaudum TaxID=45286 RepID=A0A120K1I5_9SACH|nr:HBR528Cp [Eremothecium sinecaudum]AMD19429.1 HBR528Cp [Eremothecium sinecaudum]